MADIKQYTDQIKNAVYGEEVRDSIIGALEKVNDDNNSYQDIKDQITSDKEAIDRQVENFGDMVADVAFAYELLHFGVLKSFVDILVDARQHNLYAFALWRFD